MLPKLQKLTWKDVRFLLRKRWLVYGKGMVFVVAPQYPGKAHNQRSLQVSTKISKSSVKRNMVKRVFYEQLATDLPLEKKIGTWYYKIFVYFHKNLLEELAKLLANGDKNTIKSQIKAHLHEHFTLFPDLLCRFSDSSNRSDMSSKRKPITWKLKKEKS